MAKIGGIILRPMAGLSANHSGAHGCTRKRGKETGAGRHFDTAIFPGYGRICTAEALSRYRYLISEKGESGKQKSRRTMAGQENSDSKNPIYETLSQDVLLNVSGRIRFRSDREGVFSGKKSNHILSCTGEFFGSDRGDSRQR